MLNAFVLIVGKGRTLPSTATILVTGLITGALPRLVYEFSSEPQLVPNIEYLPFLLGGLIVAVLASWFRRPRAD